MNYLITGAAGFLGSNLLRRLLNEGHDVFGVDNYVTGSIDNVIDLKDHPNFRFQEIDIKDFYDNFKNEPKIDRIVNLACPASPVAYQNNPFQTICSNTIGVMNMLKVARWYSARFLHSSTSEVYGDPTVHPQTEEYWGNVNCFGPRACYDEGKRMAETIIWEFARKYFTENRIVRIFNTYGPYMAQNDGRVVSNFIVQALKNEPITIYGDGSQTRSFCYVDDLLDIMMMVMEGEYEKPLNIGNPTEFTMNELAECVKSVVGSSSPIVFRALPFDDPKQRRPDITKVKNLFGWEPKVQLKEGIEKTAKYFEGVLK